MSSPVFTRPGLLNIGQEIYWFLDSGVEKDNISYTDNLFSLKSYIGFSKLCFYLVFTFSRLKMGGGACEKETLSNF